MQTRTLLIEIEYSEDLTVSTAHAMVGSLADGEGVVRVRAHLGMLPGAVGSVHWDSAEMGTNP